MVVLALVSSGFCVAALVWLVLRDGSDLWLNYLRRVSHDTKDTLNESFLFLDTQRLWPVTWLAGLMFALLFVWITGSWWLLLLATGAWLAVPPIILRRLRQRRRQQFNAQLPDFVLALAGALRAGLGMQPAIEQIVQQSRPPLSQEFALVLRQQRLGLGLPQALEQLQQRMPTEACTLLVSALLIARQTGGSLSDTLEAMAETLRAQLHWQGRVRALTAQGRMQSLIMAGLPLVLLLVLARLEPQAMSVLWTSWYGWLVLVLIAVLELLGFYWIRRIVGIRI